MFIFLKYEKHNNYYCFKFFYDHLVLGYNYCVNCGSDLFTMSSQYSTLLLHTLHEFKILFQEQIIENVFVDFIDSKLVSFVIAV